MKAMAQDINGRYTSATAMLYDMDEFRKNPILLFDYNTPPTDAVIAISNTAAAAAAQPEPVAPTAPRTTAQRVVAESTARQTPPQRRRPAGTSGGTVRPNPARQEPPARRTARQESEDNRMATIAVIACTVVAVVALALFLILILSGGCSAGDKEQIAVPNFLGKDYETMQDKYAYNADIHIKLNSDQQFSYSDEYEKGQIMDQRPAANTQVGKGTVIYVTVSLGKEPENVLMEDHSGKTPDAVQGYLDALKLELMYTVVEEFSEDVETGLVIRTDPMPEERLSPKSVVILYVSKGPEVIEMEMPDLSKKSVDEAKKWLNDQKMDLDVEVKEEEDLEVEEGTILRTAPAAGEKVKTGDTVTIYVAKGMKSEYMPSLAGLTEEKAAEAIAELKKDLKLTLEFVEEYDKSVELGKVIRTEPAYNEPVRTGDTVKIYISAAKKAKMPNVVGKDIQAALDLLEYAGFTNVKYDTYVESSKAKDTVLTQSHEKDTEVALDEEIVLELSKGGVEATKNHTFKLVEGMDAAYKVKIVDKTAGKTVFDGTVDAGKADVTVQLTGSGKHTYEITIDGMVFGDYPDNLVVDFGS